MKKLSIVIPLYNESESLVELHEKISETIDVMEIECEILFVDDGSTDNSYDVLSKIQEKDSRVTAIRLKTNSGKSAALQAGFDNAGGDYIITMDADLQDEPAEIPALITALDGGLDLVSGWKKNRHDPLSKTLPSKIFNFH